MTETSRFLRYATPGLLSAVVALLTATFVHRDLTIGDLAGSVDIQGLAAIVALFLASGAVGYFFATLHHALHWRRRDSAIDHSKCLEELDKADVLRILTLNGSAVKHSLEREKAWALITGIWHERLETSDLIKSANSRTDGLNDLAHSLGTARVAMIVGTIAGVLWPLSLAAPQWDKVGILAAVLVLGPSTFILHRAYVRTGRLARAVVEQVLTDALVKERKATNAAVVTHLPVERQVGSWITSLPRWLTAWRKANKTGGA